MQFELVAGERVAQLLHHLAALAHHLVHRLLVEADRLVERALRAIHGEVGVVEEFRGGAGVVGIDGDADAGAADEIGVLLRDGGEELGLQARGEVEGFGAVAHQLDGDELVAAEAGEEFALAELIAHAFGQHLQHMVADGVAMEVVDLLEAVEVDGEQGDPGADRQRGEGAVEAFEEGGAVGKAGEAVVAREVSDAPLLGEALAEVAHGIDEDGNLARGALFAAGDDLDRERRCAIARQELGLDQRAFGNRTEMVDEGREAAADDRVPGRGDQRLEGGVGLDDGAALFDHHAVDGAVGEIALAGAGAVGGLAVEHVAGEADADDEEADTGDGDGERAMGVVRRRRAGGGGERDDPHSSHGGEVERDDGQHQQAGRAVFAPGAGRAAAAAEGAYGDGNREKDGCDDVGGVPHDDRLGAEGGHAGIVHGDDAEAEEGAADARPSGSGPGDVGSVGREHGRLSQRALLFSNADSAARRAVRAAGRQRLACGVRLRRRRRGARPRLAHAGRRMAGLGSRVARPRALRPRHDRGGKPGASFWADGFEALRALDDNRDGELTGGELGGLALWRDEDGDGVSDPGEVLPANVHGIAGLSVRGARDAARLDHGACRRALRRRPHPPALRLDPRRGRTAGFVSG